MSEVLFSIEAGEGRITINRPEKSNALNLAAIDQLRRIIRKAGNDQNVRVLTITGAGTKVFCAGADLKTAFASEQERRPSGPGEYRKLIMDIISCPKPTVALAGGHALGGGLGIALACDLCLACEDVHFSTPEIQVGLFPMMVMALLYRNIGRKKATELMFLGERISATEALHYGIVNHVYARERFHAESGEFIRKLVGKNPTILAMGKRAMSRVMDQTLAKEEELLESALVDVLDSEESKKIMQSFLEKRKAKE